MTRQEYEANLKTVYRPLGWPAPKKWVSGRKVKKFMLTLVEWRVLK